MEHPATNDLQSFWSLLGSNLSILAGWPVGELFGDFDQLRFLATWAFFRTDQSFVDATHVR